MDFGLNPNQAKKYFQKKDHCLRNNIIQKYAILNIVIYNILSQTKGVSGEKVFSNQKKTFHPLSPC